MSDAVPHVPDASHLPDDRPALAAGLSVLARCGQGLWLLLGAALASGLYSSGRGQTLVPLLIGAAFACAGLLAALLRVPGLRHWHGWRPGDGRPTAAALLALVGLLPALAVAALARGDNLFWATRVAALLLALCSAGSLLGQRAGWLRLDRTVEALFTGGLWLWACVLAQDQPTASQRPVAVALLVLALLLGLLESLRWHALRARRVEQRARWPFVAAALVYALPCVLLLAVAYLGHASSVAALAGLSAVAGRGIEQWLYHEALAHVASAR